LYLSAFAVFLAFGSFAKVSTKCPRLLKTTFQYLRHNIRFTKLLMARTIKSVDIITKNIYKVNGILIFIRGPPL